MWKWWLHHKRSLRSPADQGMSAYEAASDPEALSPIPADLQTARRQVEAVFSDCEDVVLLEWGYGPGLANKAFSVYFHTLVQTKELNYMKASLQDLVAHEVGPGTTVTPEELISFFEHQGVSSQSAHLVDHFQTAVSKVMNGNIVIFFDGWDKALAYYANDTMGRQITEPITEPVVQGPHMSFVEDLVKNIGLLRGLLKTPRLKMEMFTVGKVAQRDVAFGYLEGIVRPSVLAEFKSRIAGIGPEEITETSFLEDWIGESMYTPFPQVRYTERPDSVVSSLLAGKIVVLMSGTPTTLICPCNFFEFFSSSEDFYHRTIYSSVIRILRMIAFIMAFMLPSTYIALSTFHSELLPTVLLLTILDTREGIPFPAFLEALLMEFFFEVLREAGIRMPRPIGSAVSIVGALVIGQAAIQAKIASPVMVIVVALTGIASFALPQYNLSTAIRILRFPLMVLAATLGGLGIMIGFLLTMLHLTCMRSLGDPYLAPMAPLDFKKFREVFILPPRYRLARSVEKGGTADSEERE